MLFGEKIIFYLQNKPFFVKKYQILKKVKKVKKKYWLTIFKVVLCYCFAGNGKRNDLWKLSKMSIQFSQENNSIFKKLFFFGEFDPGSGWTLAACLRHASRTRRPIETYWNWSACTKMDLSGFGFPSSGRRVSNTWVIYLRDWDNVWKRTIIPDDSYLDN